MPEEQHAIQDGTIPTPERQAQLETSYEQHKDSASPYSGSRIATLGELQWIMQRRRWSGTLELADGWYRANLSSADLSSINLSKVALCGANLQGANIHGSMLIEADLSLANLSWAHLYQANLSGAGLIETNLTGANLSFTNLSNTNITQLQLDVAAGHQSAILPAGRV